MQIDLLSNSEKKIITLIGWGEVPTRSFDELRRASGLTIGGARRVINRMEDASLIGRNALPGGGFYTTFKGARRAGLTGRKPA